MNHATQSSTSNGQEVVICETLESSQTNLQQVPRGRDGVGLLGRAVVLFQTAVQEALDFLFRLKQNLVSLFVCLSFFRGAESKKVGPEALIEYYGSYPSPFPDGARQTWHYPI